MKTELHNKTGHLSEYGLSCGYVEKSGSKELYKEGGIYHVRDGQKWQSFDRLTEARGEMFTGIKVEQVK
jgi:hypothetical protein